MLTWCNLPLQGTMFTLVLPPTPQYVYTYIAHCCFDPSVFCAKMLPKQREETYEYNSDAETWFDKETRMWVECSKRG